MPKVDYTYHPASVNDSQVGGDHYRRHPIQHWDYAAAQNLDYFQGQITKYVSRWKDKNGLEDLYKARHMLEKYIQVQEIALDCAEDAECQKAIAASRRAEGAA